MIGLRTDQVNQGWQGGFNAPCIDAALKSGRPWPVDVYIEHTIGFSGVHLYYQMIHIPTGGILARRYYAGWLKTLASRLSIRICWPGGAHAGSSLPCPA